MLGRKESNGEEALISPHHSLSMLNKPVAASSISSQVPNVGCLKKVFFPWTYLLIAARWLTLKDKGDLAPVPASRLY